MSTRRRLLSTLVSILLIGNTLGDNLRQKLSTLGKLSIHRIISFYSFISKLHAIHQVTSNNSMFKCNRWIYSLQFIRIFIAFYANMSMNIFSLQFRICSMLHIKSKAWKHEHVHVVITRLISVRRFLMFKFHIHISRVHLFVSLGLWFKKNWWSVARKNNNTKTWTHERKLGRKIYK